MATRIRTLNFLPEIFQTTTNSQFLGATLDQLVDQPNTQKIQGYVGSKFGYSINAKDFYVTEPTKTRTDYQLEPGVVFKKENEETAKDFITYPGIVDSLKLEGGITDNNNRLFESQIYAWDSFTNLDPLINYNQYYWIPEGPERITISNELVNRFQNYLVENDPNYYAISILGESNTQLNPTITLLRGGRYTFAVNQNSQFWIQGSPGVTGFDPLQPNLQTRDVYGVTNNGASQGEVIFEVPFRDAQDEYILPGNNTVDVVSTIPFYQLNGTPVKDLVSLDGVTSLEGLRVLFYDTGIPSELGFVQNFYNFTPYDTNNNLVAETTITVTNTTATTNVITCNSTASLRVNNNITFLGLPFGNINQYQQGTNVPTSTTSLVVGKMYTITEIGSTDWISVGLLSDAQIVGSISGKVLFVTATVEGSLEVGDTITGTGVTSGTTVVSKLDTAQITAFIDNGTGAAGTSLTVTSVTSGMLRVGTIIEGPGISAGTVITGYITGLGVEGVYTVNNSQLVPSVNMIGLAPIGTTMYSVSQIQTVGSTNIYGYDIIPGKIFTATGTAAGSGLATLYTPIIYYVSSILNSTQFTISTDSINAVLAPDMVAGQQYVIKFAGDTDFTLVGASSNTVGTMFTATDVAYGTGAVAEVIPAGSFEYGKYYTISSIGTTDFTSIGASSNTVGLAFVATGSGTGTGTATYGQNLTLTTASGSIVGYTNQGLLEEGYYSSVSQTFYKITYVGDDEKVINLVPDGLIPANEKITVLYGTEYVNRSFYKNYQGTVSIIPFLSALLDTLYYQDGTDPNKFGIIKVIEANILNVLEVDEDIVGKKTYTSTTGVAFTNGLKVTFSGNVYPESYINNDYYVEGVGSSIQLVPVLDLVAPEPFTGSVLIPYDTTPYDVSNYEGNSYIPVYPDYITIARNSINKNAWSRSNRWFHISVIQATATYNNNPNLLTLYTSDSNKAKRPIIEFYPNIKLFNGGAIGKNPIDFMDFRTTDALTLVAGQQNYYPDVQTYTAYTATINTTSYAVDRAVYSTDGASEEITCDDTTGFRTNDTVVFNNVILDPLFGGITAGTVYYIIDVIDSSTFTMSETPNGPLVNLSTANSATPSGARFFWSPKSTLITINSSDVFTNFQVNQFITDSTNVLPRNSIVSNIELNSGVLTLTITWGNESGIFLGATNASLVADFVTLDNYSLFDGARIIFAGDTNPEVRNKIFVSRFTQLTPNSIPLITLSEASDGEVLPDSQTVAFRGYNYQGKDFNFDGIDWKLSQQKLIVNQAPLFDVFDENGISLGNKEVYNGSSFSGTKLFSYGIGSGINDVILGFPIRYSSIDNVGDISFDVNINSETFNYVRDFTPITQKVNTGYIHNFVTATDYDRNIGWQTTVSPSTQYQLFNFNFDPLINDEVFVCDIAANLETNWPVVQVYNNNRLLDTTEYSYSVSDFTTTVVLNSTIDITTVIQIIILSTQTSKVAYYTIPVNLSNNPFNEDPEIVNVGELRLQYQSICVNNPDISGTIFGSNNFRDLGNLIPWANQIIQNSSSLVLPGAFLRRKEHNLFDSLIFNNREYIKYKTLLVDTADKIVTQQTFNPSEILDQVLDYITSSKTSEQSFFWSDMLPNKSAYITNTYKFANNLDTSIYPLNKTYDFSAANYNGVLVYLTRTISNFQYTVQLVKGIDYTVSDTSPSLTITLDLIPNDIVIIKEYNQTYGSYAPNTPTKLGLYPAFVPEIVQDINYNEPTWFIKGHDGSYNKLYGEYNETFGVLIDFRDQILFEFEKRIYNNLKLSNVIPIQEYEISPGFFRTTDYSLEEYLLIYTKGFLEWIGQNRLDYKTQIFNKLNQLTFNYFESGNKINFEPIIQGYWRGIYKYYYDTFNPDTMPWEMLGLVEKPSWWESRYGEAPYTSDNYVLWNDLAQGINWNNGNPFVVEYAIRPELLQLLPVDSSGNLVSPLTSVVGSYVSSTFQRDWKVGDIAPVELSYRRSSSWPFDLMRILALTKPAKFYNLAVNVDDYKYNVEFNQYLVNNRSHLKLSDIQIYGSGTASTSYINWIVDYEKQIGLDATTNIKNMLDTMDVRLVYRLAGFSDKTLLKFYVEKGTPNNRNASLLIPDESYQVLLYDNQSFDTIMYTGIIIQLVNNGYAVFGNSQFKPVFSTLEPLKDGNYKTVKIEDLSVKLPVNYSTTEKLVPYGTIFYTVQEVAEFIAAYGAKLNQQGMIFEYLENEIEVNWDQMVAEFLYYAQTGWELDSIVTLNPAATNLNINKEGYIVQPLTLQQSNFVLNDNLYPILLQDLNIVRDQTDFTVIPLNQGDSIGYGQFSITNFEHGIVFNNLTLFDDVIYNLVTGLRQQRVTVNGWKTAEWNGTVTTAGFILNQDNIQEWSNEVKYTKGSIVKYKNKYFTALKIIQPSAIFSELDWKRTDYDQIQKGLLPNPSTRAYESTIYYNVNQANLENDGDLLSFGLIGYRPREYMTMADLTDITQVNVYKNLIREKGTLSAANAFKGATLPQGGIKYDIYENWAIKSGEFGGVLSSNFVQIKLNENNLTGNPATVGLVQGGIVTAGLQQVVPLNTLFNYGRSVTTSDILTTIPASTPTTVFPDAGYVNFNDVKMSSYFYSGMDTAVNAKGIIVPINNLLVRDYFWIANYLEKWQVMTPKSLGQVVFAKNNLNSTVTIQFAEPHNLDQYQPFAIVNFNDNINGYYVANLIPTPYTVLISLSLNPSITSVSGLGIGLEFQSQRVATPADIDSLPLLDSEFIKNTVWVDTNNDGSWAVYRKAINYNYENQITVPGSSTFGSAVVHDNTLGYLISDSSSGLVYRYTYDALTNGYTLKQIITESASFGSNIAYAEDIVVITEPTGLTLRIYKLIENNLVNSLVEIEEKTTLRCNSIAISDDKRWLYVGNTNDALVYVYHITETEVAAGSFVSGKVYTILSAGTTDFTLIGSPNNDLGTKFVATGSGTGSGIASVTTYTLVETISSGLTVNDDYGYSLTTNQDGSVLAVGAPKVDYSGSIENWGNTLVYDRLVQTIESTNSVVLYVLPATYALAWTVTPHSARTGSAVTGATITANASMTGFAVNSPVIFQGINGTTNDFKNSGIIPNKVYYIFSRSGSTFQIKDSLLDTSSITFTNATGLSFNIYVQQQILDVYKNGVLVDDSNYAIIGSNFVYVTELNAGDIVKVSSTKLVNIQTLTSPNTPRIGVNYGYSVDVNKYGNELLVGAPFELSTGNIEGAVYRYTNGGSSYGIVIGTTTCAVTTTRKLMINGYLVIIPAGNATQVANIINSNRITNVQASASDGKIIISLINFDLANPNQKLLITSDSATTLTELGITSFTATQTVLCPHTEGPTQFGTAVQFNEFNSFVASAPAGTRYIATTFDFVDDESDNDTVFDNNATQFIDSYANAGAAYMFDYLSQYNESLSNLGEYVYAQSVNAINELFGSEPMYGKSISFNENKVLIGSPNFKLGSANGQVVIYENISSNQQNWSVYRSSSPVVDIQSVSNIQIFDGITNDTLINLDYIDPLQGKILGATRENIDFISNADPARYNLNATNVSSSGWGEAFLGMIWLNTTNMKYVNYHQDDLVYNTKYWGTLFPGSDVAVFTWIESPVVPAQYQGPGTVFGTSLYSIQYKINNAGEVVPVYYFWVRNTNIVFTRAGKTLADTTIASYINSPVNSGISYFVPLLPNSFGLYNCESYINSLSSILSLTYSTGMTDSVAHNAYDLIRANYADDFLPGVPSFTSANREPESLYAKLVDSLSGTDKFGNVVPDPFLPKAVQTGVLARPKQSFFLNRLLGLKNYIQYFNEILKELPFFEILSSSFLNKSGEFYDVSAYWTSINWWATGYSDSTKSALQVPTYADLSTLSVESGTIVTVEFNGSNGSSETYIYNIDSTWTRIGLQNGTLQIKSSIYDYANNGIGFGNNFYDTVPFDAYPSEETKYIVRTFNEELPEIYHLFRNKALILLFEYIQSEAIENQNYLTWLNKTSLVDVTHTIRELIPYQLYKSDNQDFLAGYINEVKPYHVVIKDFLFKYTGTDVFEGDVSDFDLPSSYNSTYEKFISPQLVYSSIDNEYEYLPTDTIWQNNLYSQWYQNYGLSVSGQKDYLLCSLVTYITLNSLGFFVDNALGLPTTGTVLIDEELINYTSVDRNLNFVSGLTRGVNNTLVATHIPGQFIYIDLPGVILLNGGRGYVAPPRVFAYTDPLLYPSPRRAAILEPVLAGDVLISVIVVDPGEGYIITPTIVIDPASTATFNSDDINLAANTIRLFSNVLVTGDIIQYKTEFGSTTVGGLVNDQWYYVNVLETSPLIVIGLYTTYENAIDDIDRVNIYSVGSGTHTINQGARATAIASSTPTRENIISLRYDRTSYNSKVIVWRAGEYYGAYYAGRYNNTLTTSSSSIQLQSTQPPIDTILASAQGVSFEIMDIRNDQTVTYSSFLRDVSIINGTGDFVRLIPKAFSFEGQGTISGNILTITSVTNGKLQPGTYIYNSIDPATTVVTQLTVVGIEPGGLGTYEISETYGTLPSSDIKGFESNTSGTTMGFYPGLPIKFKGQLGNSGLIDDVVYYVSEILNTIDFKVSASNVAPYTPIDLTTYVVGLSGLNLIAGEVVNQAVLTITYPGILEATTTISGSNNVVIPLNETGTGGTNGFYLGMTVFFTGNVFGGIVENQVYYINGIVDNQTCILSLENNIKIFNILSTFTATDTVLLEVSNDNFTLNEPVIFTNFNASVVDLISGQEYIITRIGTTDFTLVGASSNTVGLLFTASGTGTGTGQVSSNIFGNLVAGETYYITDKYSTNEIKVSTSINGSVFNLIDAIGTGEIISQIDAVQLTNATGSMAVNVNLPVSPGQINGQLFTLYKTSEQFDNKTGSIGDLVQRTVTATLSGSSFVNRIIFNTIDGGLDNLYINMPINIGSNITGAEFTGSISGTTLTVASVASGYITATNSLISGLGITAGTKITSQLSGTTGGAGTYTVDTSQSVGPLTITSYTLNVDTTYYITDLGNTSITSNGTTAGVTGGIFTGSISGFVLTITSISSGLVNVGATIIGTGIASGTKIEAKIGLTYIVNISQTVLSTSITSVIGAIVCTEANATDRLYLGMPIIFSGTGLGGVSINTEYFVSNIIDGLRFSVGAVPDGSVIPITSYIGIMYGRGEPWITVSDSIGGTNVELVYDTDDNTFTQSPQTTPVFDVSYIMGGYRIAIVDAGSGFAINNTIIITGNNFGGTSPANDLTLTVNSINEISFDPINNKLTSLGEITSAICSGNVPGLSNQYYLKVISPTELEVYSNPLLTVPVSGIDFPYVGITTSTVSALSSTIITVNTTDFVEGDLVVFTGNVAGNLITGKTYYLSIVSGSSGTVSDIPGGSPITVGTVGSTNFVMTKYGDFAVLPEPFYFNQSIVKYNGEVYVCVVSNNDEDFVLGKWERLTSGDRQLNGLDRVIGYYSPTDDMPGIDLTQLVTGITYPNSVYKGNEFQPSEQFTLDTELLATTFYPTALNMAAVSNRKSDGFIAVVNTDSYSGVMLSSVYTTVTASIEWEVNKIQDSSIQLTDIITTVTGKYLITSRNVPNTVIVATSTLPDESDLIFKSIFAPTKYLNSICVSGTNQNVYVAVGYNIVTTSDAGETWIEKANFNNNPKLTYEFNSVKYCDIGTFVGYIAVGSGQQFDYSSGLTEVVNTNIVATSSDISVWNTTQFTYQAFNSVACDTEKLIAVGENGVIYYSLNGTTWLGINETTVLTTNGITNQVNLLEVDIFTTGDRVRFYGANFGGLVDSTDYYVGTINSSTQSIGLFSDSGLTVPVTLSTASPIDLSLLLRINKNINSVEYISNLSKFLAVGDDGYILTSNDGFIWTTIVDADITENLYGITYDASIITVVGDNSLIILSTDLVNWTVSNSTFIRPEQIYNIQGESFDTGYGPEELVAGVVSDNMTMIVTTRPGTNWDATVYQHVGYKVISLEITPTNNPQLVYSFDGYAQTPAQIRLGVITPDPTNIFALLDISIYEGIDYSVDWVNKFITLSSSLTGNQKLRIDIYETGNGDQLVKSNTDVNPIRFNSATGWNEVYLNCNYSANIFNGSGVIRPGSQPLETLAIATESGTNTILCTSVKDFVVNDPISFQGAVFGNIQEDVIYYVKTVSNATNTITVSTFFNSTTGTAGATYPLADATGLMYAIIQIGSGSIYSDPLVYRNGTKLINGISGSVTKTQANNDTITVNSTVGMIVGSRVSFSDTMFGSVLQGGILNANETITGRTYRIDNLGNTNFTLIGASSNLRGEFFVATGTGTGTGTVTAVYYVEFVFDSNQFTVSATNGGPILPLTDSAGGASFITNDYAFGIQPNGIQATIIFSYPYEEDLDYLTYTVFGETSPVQYGYTIPEIELFTASSQSVFNLSNYNSGTNPQNAIVEVNGLRVEPSAYTIDANLDTLTFVSSQTGTVAVTTYNLTDRQYFATNEYTGKTVSAIVNVSNALSVPLAVVFVTATDAATQRITTTGSTATFVVGQYIQFTGTSFGNILTNGTVYIITGIISLTQFTINTTIINGSGIMVATVGGQETIRVTTQNAHGLATNNLVRMDGLTGSIQLNNDLYYVHVLSSVQFDIYEFDPANPSLDYDPAPGAVNYPVTNVSSYTGGGFVWETQTFVLSTTTVTNTDASNNRLTCTDKSDLVVGTPIIFMEDNVLIGDLTIGGIVTGKTYYVKDIETITVANEFTISETRDGATFNVTTDSGTASASQWNQTNTDRLWVTINGYRVPSTSLRVNSGNDISILDPISSSDIVVITSMIPSSTPDEETYLLNVNQLGAGEVYRENFDARTWLTTILSKNANIIYLNNVRSLISIVNQSTTVPAMVNGKYYIGLNVDRNLISGLTVVNRTKNLTITSSYYSVEILGLVPTLVITAGSSIIQVSDILDIEIYEGNLLYVAGEQIKFSQVNIANNTVSGLERGINGTGVQEEVPIYEEVYSFIPANKLTDTQYNTTWNPIPGVYNVTEGDPLQIAETPTAIFLKPSPTRGDLNDL
jgi:hypothetical protein